jgi:hypothetical protein
MEIKIEQQKISIGRDKYQVFVDGEKCYYATTPFLNIKDLKATLYSSQERQPLISCEDGSLFKKEDPSFFIFRGNEKYGFGTVDFNSRHYGCEVGNDWYDIFAHTGLKCSIYKNDEQIGWWTQNRFKFFKGDKFTITCNSNADIELLIMFCLIFDLGDTSDGGLLNFNTSNIAINGKKFNENWQPI